MVLQTREYKIFNELTLYSNVLRNHLRDVHIYIIVLKIYLIKLDDLWKQMCI